MLERIADGRTDLVFEYLADGHAADSVDGGGVSLGRVDVWPAPKPDKAEG